MLDAWVVGKQHSWTGLGVVGGPSRHSFYSLDLHWSSSFTLSSGRWPPLLVLGRLTRPLKPF